MDRSPGREQTGISSYFPRGCPHDGIIDPNWSDEQVERFIRAMIYPPYPVARYGDHSIQRIEDFLRIRDKESTVEVRLPGALQGMNRRGA